MPDVKIESQNNGQCRQLLATIVVNLLATSSGIACGWTSPVIPQLRSSNPPVGDAPMTADQISWIGSLLPIGGLLTIPFCSVLVERLGRKKFALLTGLPHIVSWLLVIFGWNYTCLCAARLFMGMANAMTFFVVPLYVSEIASEDIRGFLGSFLIFAINVGTLFAYVAGAYLSYRLFACLSLLFSLGFVATFGFMPETPAYLVRRNWPDQARKSLMFLRGNNEGAVEHEITKLRAQAMNSNTVSSKIKLSDLIRDRGTRMGVVISLVLLGGQQLSGIFAMMTYAETIFKQAGSSVSAEVAAIIMEVFKIIGSYVSTVLMDRAGRRPLTLISCAGMTMSHAIVGLFFYLQQNNHDVSSIAWLPVIAASSYVVTYCLGIGPVPFVVVSEVFRLDVSSFATNMCFVYFWAAAFVSMEVFSLSMQFLGVGGCFFVLASFCAATFLFAYCLVPETKGRDRQDIVDELAGIGPRHRKTGNADSTAMSKPV